MTAEDREWLKQFQAELKKRGQTLKGKPRMHPDYFDIQWGFEEQDERCPKSA